MLVRLAQLTVRRRRAILITSVILFAVAGAIGGGVAEHLSSGGFDDPGAESTRAGKVIDEVFDAGEPNVVLLVTARAGTVDAPAVVAEAQALTSELAAEPGIEQAFSYWSLGRPPPLRSNDSRQALVLARIGGDEDAVDARIETLSPAFTRQTAHLDVRVGGHAEVFRQVGGTVEKDLATAESVAIPITLLLLV
ncbi:MAG: MMPL family transporter, partial [Actinobacteria bacterium]|nr:MMPL family transporter [Actinomycetota bacterium]